jgi:hypothetical protein
MSKNNKKSRQIIEVVNIPEILLLLSDQVQAKIL